eukprot:3930194-Alexandrium_andersonii.AAC.1
MQEAHWHQGPSNPYARHHLGPWSLHAGASYSSNEELDLCLARFKEASWAHSSSTTSCGGSGTWG